MGAFGLFGIMCPDVKRQSSNTERTLFILDFDHFAIVTPLWCPGLQKLYKLSNLHLSRAFLVQDCGTDLDFFRPLVWFGLFRTPGVSWALNSFRRLQCIVLHVFAYTTPFSSASLSRATNINTERKHKTQNVKTNANDSKYNILDATKMFVYLNDICFDCCL